MSMLAAVAGTPRRAPPAPADLYLATVLGDGAAGFWRLNETSGSVAHDSSGNGYDGAYMGAPVLNAGTAANGQPCPYFDGVDDGVQIPFAPAHNTPGTFEIWADLGDWANTSDGHGALIKIGDQTGGVGIGVGAGNWDSAGNRLVGITETVSWLDTNATINLWGVHCFHMRCEANGVDYSLFIDGVKVGLLTSASAPLASTPVITIGFPYGRPSRYLKMRPWDAAWYPGNLSDEQIITHARLGFAQHGTFIESFEAAGAVGQFYYRQANPTYSYDAVNKRVRFSGDQSQNFISFDRWPIAAGKFSIEADYTLVSDSAGRQHLGMYLAAFTYPGGSQGVRPAQLDSKAGYYTRWNGGNFQDDTDFPNPSGVPALSVGQSSTFRIDYDGAGIYEMFRDGVSLGTVNKLYLTRALPGVFLYGNTLDVNAIRLTKFDDVITPIVNNNVAFAARFRPVNGAWFWTGSSINGNAIGQNTFLTDEVTDTSAYGIVTPWGVAEGTVPVAVEIDLGARFRLNRIQVFHYYGDGRTTHGTKTQVSADGITWTTVFNSAVSGEYVETSSGHVIDFAETTVRYIRDWAQGSTSNALSAWVDIRAFRM